MSKPTSEVFNEDCITVMKRYPDKFFDLAVVDPPYGIGYSQLVGLKKKKHGWKERKSSEWDNVTPNVSYWNQRLGV